MTIIDPLGEARVADPRAAVRVRSALGGLVASGAPQSGRLILWHSPPGTGKTTALRALSREWRDWCSVHYVTDPEAFLATGSGYLVSVLTGAPAAGGDRAPSWKLVVLEESGELLAADARERTGQALSRLLNVTDGMLGQGMNVATLVTTNEPLVSMHPAVTRPGRCWAEVTFEPLGVAEANGWLDAQGTTNRVTQPAVLADLYGILRGRVPATTRPFGFGRAA